MPRPRLLHPCLLRPCLLRPCLLRLCLLLTTLLFLAACGGNSSPQKDAAPPATPPGDEAADETDDIPDDIDKPSDPPAPTAPEDNEAGGETEDGGGAEPTKTPEEAARCARLAPEANSVYLSPYGDDKAAGVSPASAWQTLARLRDEIDKARAGEASLVAPGTQILFERGSVFYGYLNLNDLRGAASKPYRLGAYCDGDNPVVTGFQQISNWRSLGNNVWEADCPGCGSASYALRLDGELQALARYPNAGEGDEAGYNYYDNHSNNPTSLTDAPLSGQDWTGAEAVVKTWPWVLDRFIVDAHSGRTLNLRASEDNQKLMPSYPLQGGYGYFIQNHVNALDKHGEWVYDTPQQKLFVYLSDNPQNHQIEISRAHTLLSIDQSEHIAFEDIVLEGSHELALWGRNCTAISLENVTVRDLGGRGVQLDDCRNVAISKSQIKNTFDNALYLANCSNCTVSENKIENIAMKPGMGASGDLRYLGVVIGGQNTVFEYNRVLGVGYIPVTAQSYATIRYNEIDDYSSVKVDGAGIYTFEATGVTITNNIVTNGRGSTAGIPWGSTVTNGIYTDQRTRDTLVKDNTFAYSSGSGMKIFTGDNVRFENNTVFAAHERSLEMLERSDAGYHSNITLENNIFVSERPGDELLRMETDKGESRFRMSGALNNNIYCAPLATPFVRRDYRVDGNRIPFRESVISFENWQSYHDADSQLCPYSYERFAVTGAATNLIASGDFDGNATGWRASGRFELSEGGVRATGAGELHYAFGSVDNNAVYRLRFDVRGKAGAAVRVQLKNENGTGSLSPLELVSVKPETQRAELFIKANRNSSARLQFSFADEDALTVLDNIELVKVTGAAIKFADKVRLELNPSKTTKSVSLDGVYLDLDGERYSGSVSVAPYGSLVLFRE